MASLKTLERLGRTRLSSNFFLRDFLHSEVAEIEGIANIPVDPELAIEAGRKLCENVLEPMQAQLGRISIRSAYRSPEVNRVGNEKRYNCASNDHIPAYREMTFYPKLAAFNINWYSGGAVVQTISAQVPDPATGRKGILTRTGWGNFAGPHPRSYEQWMAGLGS